MGFFNSLKNWSDNNKRRKQEREARKQAVNQNPTEEQLKKVAGSCLGFNSNAQEVITL